MAWLRRPNGGGKSLCPERSASALRSRFSRLLRSWPDAPRRKAALRPASAAQANGEIGLATRAMAALNSNDVPAAIGFAERAVAKTPNDAGFRALLGNAYFAGGRFQSAEAAYQDSLTLYSNQPQVVLKLALVEIALGKSGEALSFLDAAKDVLDPADYGLAVALAGRPADAIEVLETAARAPGADARVRQNLALAFALAGDWTNARDRRGAGRARRPGRRADPPVDAARQPEAAVGPGGRARRSHSGGGRSRPADPARAEQDPTRRLAAVSSGAAPQLAAAAPAAAAGRGRLRAGAAGKLLRPRTAPAPVAGKRRRLRRRSALRQMAAPKAPAAPAPKARQGAAAPSAPRRGRRSSAAAARRGNSNAVVQLGSLQQSGPRACGLEHHGAQVPRASRLCADERPLRQH